ncbi:TRAP transporter large permease subunit [Bradyrhizobium sp.]|uniref:TRAP transporter large permease n=1 Tax=Bradyrhizobium sp. TaxID=376 RepID=UPI003C1DCBC7
MSQPPANGDTKLERVIQGSVSFVASALVLIEIVVLVVGVVSRFVFHQPLVWVDEIASICFLWLAMMGATVALLRREHMGLTAFVLLFSPGKRLAVQALVETVVALFLILILPWAYGYALDEWAIETPALGLHNTYRAAAMPASIGLILFITVSRWFRLGWRRWLPALGGLAAVALLLHAGAPLIRTMGAWNLIIFFVLLRGTGVALSVPIAFAFGLTTTAFLLTLTNTPLSIVVSRMDEGMSTLVLLSVPLFVFLGLLLEMTGMARAMIRCLASLVGHIRGGLCYVLLGAMYLVSGISGAKAADMAAVAPALLPEMKRRGMKDSELVSLLAASSAMSETIPPSLVLITIGSVTGVSIAALFTGGLMPALVLAATLAVLARWRARNEDMSNVTRVPAREIIRLTVIATPALALPFLIRTAVVEGVATATEVSTIGIAYCVIAGIFIYRQFDWRRLYPMLVETACLSGAILLIIGTATSMGWVLTQSGFSRNLAQAITTLPGGAFTFMAGTIAAFVVLGSVLEGIPAIVVFGPLMFPSARMTGINEVHYAMVVILAMGVGLFAPPVGVGYYAACVIGRADPSTVMRDIWPYLGALLVGLIIIAALPWFSTGFLPR